MTRWWNGAAVAGALMWFVVLLVWPSASVAPFRFVHELVALGPLVVVPLALGHLVRRPGRLAWALFGLWAVGAPCAIASVRLPTGATAISLAGVWCLCTLALGGFGVARVVGRLRSGTLWHLPSLCMDAALLYIPVGGVWLLADRAAMELMGFPLLIVVLTAAHFHFAGFAAPIMAGLVGQSLPRRTIVWKVAAVAAMAGPPVVAAGITISPLVEVIGSLFLAAGMTALAFLMIFPVGRHHGGVARALLTLAGASIVGTMMMACLYAAGEFVGIQLIDIPIMVATHGVANVFGFTILGMVAFALAPPEAAS